MVSWWDVVYWIFAPWGHCPIWDNAPPRELVELVEEKRLEPCRALDVGCGTGNYIIYLASKGFQAVGIDISSAAVKKAKAKAAKRKVDCTFHAVNFLDVKTLNSVITEPFDLVMDYGCFHSISKSNRRSYPLSLKYVTYPGSRYLLWAFAPGRSTFFGGRGSVDPKEVGELFVNDFAILEERPATREKMLYILERK